MMHGYKILRPIVLGFLTRNDAYDRIIDPENGHLKFDGQDIIFIDSQGKEHVSHTSNNAIALWLEQGILELNDERTNSRTYHTD